MHRILNYAFKFEITLSTLKLRFRIRNYDLEYGTTLSNPKLRFQILNRACKSEITLGVWSRYCDQLGSNKMSEQHPLATSGRLLKHVTCMTVCALISRDAADTRIPAVWRLSAAHHGLSAMPAARALLLKCIHSV